jgi:hypothetical protein
MMPRMFFGSGTAAQLGKSASLFYLALCEHANRHGKATFKAADHSIASDTGMSERDFSAARKALKGQGLISFTREKGHSYVYTLVRLELKWVRLEDRPRVKLKARGPHSSKAADAHKETPISVPEQNGAVGSDPETQPDAPAETVCDAPGETELYAPAEGNEPLPLLNWEEMFRAPANYARPYPRKI